MAVLNFKEIPEAHKSSGLQDTFELFARDFLSFIGYRIVTDPDRGPDGGADFIVEERRSGVGVWDMKIEQSLGSSRLTLFLMV